MQALIASSVLLKAGIIHSTDFEVHRNWMAITHSLPLSEWYTNAVSEWTLDYPPLFAYFELLLSQLARFADPQMLSLRNLGYASVNTVYFMRGSVIVTELLLYVAVWMCIKPTSQPKIEHVEQSSKTSSGTIGQIDTAQFIMASFAFNPLLILIDHIHFQYNAFLYAILFLSLAALKSGKFVVGSTLFTVLLCFKHIYLYLAAPFFVYILSAYCFKDQRFNVIRFATVGLTVISVLVVSFGMFVGQLEQVIARMFPFGRGLVHSYWAGNVWALYAFTDRLLVHAMPLVFGTAKNVSDGLTRGIVGQITFTHLPQITPFVTLTLTVLSQLAPLIILFNTPSYARFLDCLILSGFSAFMLGWHVHEKAVMMITLIIALRAFESKERARVWVFVSAVGVYGVFPLIFGGLEGIIKVCLLVGWVQGCMQGFRYVFGSDFKLGRYESAWLWIMVPLHVMCELVHPGIGWMMLKFYETKGVRIQEVVIQSLVDKIAYLPLMLTSVYVSMSLCYGWLSFYRLALQTNKLKSS